MTLCLAGPETVCPSCEREFVRISQHWDKSDCEHPLITEARCDFLTGLLLGGGSVQDAGMNNHLIVGTRHRPLADWLFSELGWLAHSIRRDESHGDHGQFYRVRTHAHPALAQYREWYVNGRKRLPECVDLGPRSGRVWWALAGGLQWSNAEYATTRIGTFSALDDERATRIMAILSSVGLDPTRAGKRVQLAPKQTTGWLDWIGEPVPGVGYKWANEIDIYREAKRDAEAIRASLQANPDLEHEW